MLIKDEDEEDEERFLLLGLGATLRILVVCHCHRARDEVEAMRKSYDFSKGKKNPYARRLEKQITIRLDEDTLRHFKQLAEEAEVPYQTLISLFLRDCARGKKRLTMSSEAA